jgi:hypothetical protein
MMFRNLVDEVVRQRLWPIPAVAVVVAVAAPALFLKSAPAVAPIAATAAPTPAVAAKLPARAERLLAATTPEGSLGGATGAAQDPFRPPAARHAAAHSGAAAAGGSKKKASTSSGSTSAASPTKPVPVVILNADGSAPTSSPKADSSSGAGTTKTTTTPSTATPAVDVRFGAVDDGHVHRSVPRLQPYFIHGKLAAVFVKYSPGRHKAVFAVAPGIVVSGPTKCRREHGVCRYLDIAAGSYAGLAMSVSGTIAHRRLDVLGIDSTPASVASTATTAKDENVNGCLLRKLQAQTPTDAPVDRGACEGSK